MTISAYWWSPRRDPRSFISEVRHNSTAWVRMQRAGGTPFQNFGDELSAKVIWEATGRRAIWTPVERAEALGIGSVIDLYIRRGGQGMIWGSGLRNMSPGLTLAPNRIAAVRGRLTRDALDLPEETVLGDPGLIARSIYQSPRRRSGTLVLPHFSEFRGRTASPILMHLRAQGGKVVVPSAPVDTVCASIARADHLVTSSLHGLVVADALGTPATLVRFTQTREPIHKYDDYNSAFGLNSKFESPESVADPARRIKLRDEAARRVEHISARVDAIVQDLLQAARQLS